MRTESETRHPLLPLGVTRRQLHPLAWPGSVCVDQDPRFFRAYCADCHDNTTWEVAGFAHPTRSCDCAQCHQAPPRHYMKHFKMLSAKVARQPHAEARERYSCHLTTSSPDIRGVGFCKHH